ncbi:MAG TPA: hypothetical protein P5519_06535 [Spirochaetia bacterium]|nr:hypothetical protein [Spirochaetia bacterium]
MKKLLVLCLLTVMICVPVSVSSQEFLYEPGIVSLSIAGSALPLVSFETEYALLSQFMVEGELGIHIGNNVGGSIAAHAGLALPSLPARELYRYKGFEYYGAGIGVFLRQYPLSTWYFEYSLQAFADFSWQPETLMMYFFISLVPEIICTPKMLNWETLSFQGALRFPIHFHENFYSFGIGFTVRLLITPFAKVKLL